MRIEESLVCSLRQQKIGRYAPDRDYSATNICNPVKIVEILLFWPFPKAECFNFIYHILSGKCFQWPSKLSRFDFLQNSLDLGHCAIQRFIKCEEIEDVSKDTTYCQQYKTCSHACSSIFSSHYDYTLKSQHSQYEKQSSRSKNDQSDFNTLPVVKKRKKKRQCRHHRRRELF